MKRRPIPRPKRPGEPTRYFSATCFGPNQLDLFDPTPRRRRRRPKLLWRLTKDDHPGLILEEESHDN